MKRKMCSFCKKPHPVNWHCTQCGADLGYFRPQLGKRDIDYCPFCGHKLDKSELATENNKATPRNRQEL